ncbi:patatin-like phospholipase family protein [Bordetella petrii]|nr:patatin-like phospholipase family protein [Bordetella petrii]
MPGQVQKCFVFGGGGVTGIAWEVGIMAGLSRAAIKVTPDCLLIGTSAGSVTSAELAHGVPAELLLARQLQPPEAFGEVFREYSQQAAHQKNRVLMDKVQGDLAQARQKIGAYARRAETPALAARRAIIEARLSHSTWPRTPLRLTAVDTDTGERIVLDARSGVALADAVMASCAVPGVWPTVPFQGRQLMDGGLCSITNADLARGAAHVLVLAPLGYCDDNPVSGHLRAEIQALRAAGARVEVAVPDARSRAAIGDNVLDPAGRRPSAEAGLAQGLQLAQALEAAWRG